MLLMGVCCILVVVVAPGSLALVGWVPVALGAGLGVHAATVFIAVRGAR